MATKGGSENIKTAEEQAAERRRIKDARRSRQTKGSKAVRPVGSDLVSQIEQDRINAEGVEYMDRLNNVLRSSSPTANAELRDALFTFVNVYTSVTLDTLRNETSLQKVPFRFRRYRHAYNKAIAKVHNKYARGWFIGKMRALEDEVKQEQELLSA